MKRSLEKMKCTIDEGGSITGRRREELKIDEVTTVVWLWVSDLKFGGKNAEAGLFGNLGI